MAIDLADEAVRERLAERAYYRERLDERAADMEHADPDGPEPHYHTLSWGSLDAWAQRPYRTAVAEVADQVLKAGVA